MNPPAELSGVILLDEAPSGEGAQVLREVTLK